MKLGAVVATLDERPAALAKVLQSLLARTPHEVQIVVVSQGEQDQRRATANLVDSLGFQVAHIEMERGLSRARNGGAAKLDTDLLCFPDDDCHYLPGAVDSIVGIVESAASNADVVAVPVFGQPSERPLGRPPTERTAITPRNCHRTVLSAGLITRTATFRAVNGFDESLGLGAQSPWGAGEETDFVLRALRSGHHAEFHPIRAIAHPDDSTRSFQSELGYGLGIGYACGRNSPVGVGFSLAFRPLVRSGSQLLRGSVADATQSTLRSAARTAGFLAGRLDTRDSRNP